MKNRRMLIAGVIVVATGAILAVVGSMIARLGISSHFEGWWIFGSTVTDYGVGYWIGLGLALSGICIAMVGAVLLLIIGILEVTEEKREAEA